jgi:predicted O-methyltransferase YrrM
MENNLDYMWEGATDRKIQQIREEWEWLISNISPNGKTQNILEIGCYDGGSSWYLNHFSKNMTTVDLNIPCRFNPADLGEGYKYIGGDSHDPTNVKYFKEHDWDFVFIDGDHSYEGVKADFYNILPYLKKNTPVAFHDIVMSPYHHTHGCYVGEFWRDLKIEYKATKFEEYSTNNEWAGIGILWT